MYSAFISYSHAADGKLAEALQNALQKFAKPWYKVRNLNVFRDETSLSASPQLWTNIQSALEKSEFFIYMASPVSSKSVWINKEIEYWLNHKPLEKLLIVLTDGEINWDDKLNSFSNGKSDCLPNILQQRFEEEPYYIDLRTARTLEDVSLTNPIFKKEVLKLAAHLHHKQPRDLASEEVISHRKTIRARNSVIIIFIALFFTAIGAAWVANRNAYEAKVNLSAARIQKKVADSNAVLAKQQRDLAIRAGKVAGESAKYAELQRNTAQIERDNALFQKSVANNERERAVTQQRIATGQTRIAFVNYLLSEAKSLLSDDPTVALRLLHEALKIGNDATVRKEATKIYRENNFYRVVKKQKEAVAFARFSPDLKYIFTGSDNKTASLLDLNGETIQKYPALSTDLTCAAFSPDGKTIVAGDWGLYTNDFSPTGNVILFDLKGNILLQFKAHDGAVTSIGFSPDGKTIFSCSTDDTCLWDLKGNLIRSFVVPFTQDYREHNDLETYRTIAMYLPDGKRIVTAGYQDHIMRFWSLDGSILSKFKDYGDVRSLAISPDGKNILVGYYENTARLLDFHGKVLLELQGHPDIVSSVAFSSNGKLMVTGCGDNTVRLWNQDGRLLQEFRGHHSWVSDTDFSPDGKMLLTSSADSTVLLWNLKGVTAQEFNSEIKPVSVLTFTPDGKSVFAGSDDYERSYDIKGKFLKQIEGSSFTLERPDISKDISKTISIDHFNFHAAELKDKYGHVLQEYKLYADTLLSAAISQDGKKIVTGYLSGRICVWDAVLTLDEFLNAGIMEPLSVGQRKKYGIDEFAAR